MENIFFGITYAGVTDTLIKLLIFLGASGLLLFIVWFALTKLIFRKSRHRKEINLRLTFLWAITVFVFLLNVYFFVLFWRNGADALLWNHGRFLLGMIAQLVLLIGVILFFFLRRASLGRLIKENSIH